MNKKELKLQEAEIIKQYGDPIWNGRNTPENECARKLYELRIGFERTQRDIAKAKKLAGEVGKLDTVHSLQWTGIPEDVLRAEWLITFNELQQRIVKQWIKDTNQSAMSVARVVGCEVSDVKRVFGLEAFKMLRNHLTRELKTLLPLPAMQALLGIVRTSQNEKLRFDAAKIVLGDAGLIKTEQLNVEIHKPEEALDEATQEKYRTLARQIRESKKES